MTRDGNYITIDSKEYYLSQEPIRSYPDFKYISHPYALFSSSPLFRGYFAKWEVTNNQLLLLEFDGGRNFIFNSNNSFNTISPNNDKPIFANWFSGKLGVELGEVISSDYHFGDQLEYYFTLLFKNGILLDCNMVSRAAIPPANP